MLPWVKFWSADCLLSPLWITFEKLTQFFSSLIVLLSLLLVGYVKDHKGQSEKKKDGKEALLGLKTCVLRNGKNPSDKYTSTLMFSFI